VTMIFRWSTEGEAWWIEETGGRQVVPRDVRRRCERLLADLNVPVPLDMAALRAEVSRTTGRPIEVRRVDAAPRGLCGMWVSIGGTDVIYVVEGTSEDHQRQVELHELSHILCGHIPETVPIAVMSSLVPDLDPELVERMLGRTHFDEKAEFEAELLATMIACAGTDWVPEPRRKIPASAADVVQRIDRDLSHWS
jgi:hypothetical protein